MALVRTEFYRSNLLSVRHVACRSAQKEVSDAEFADSYTLILPLKGAFVEHFSTNRYVTAEPTIALLFQPGQASKISHPAGNEDDCLVFDFSAGVFQDATGESEGLETGAHTLLSPPAQACRNLLWSRLKQQRAPSLEIEETGIALLYHFVQNAGANPQKAFRTLPQRSSILEKIEATKLALLKFPEQRWNLAGLSERVDSSPFHLTRMFQKYVGTSLHRYLLHTRLAKSLGLLLETDLDLTTIAFDLGFSSHSHFTSVFRRMTGVSPRDYRLYARRAENEALRHTLLKHI